MVTKDIRVILPDGSDGRAWRLFSGPQAVLAAYWPEDVLPVLAGVEQALLDGKQVAGFMSYEAAAGLDSSFCTHALNGFPLAWFGVFAKSSPFHFGDCGSFSLGEWQASISKTGYNCAIERIREYLLKGDTYQVNYTMRLRTGFKGEPLSLFRSLNASQRAGCSAFVETDDFALCSVSPELFFTLDGNRLVSRPMKGTIRRGRTLEEDRMLSSELAESEKNKAENVMIVDMVRNDMGRVAAAGSVTVSGMYTVEKYPTVFQMTSTVECLTDSSFSEIIKALFPCASITGAPKVRTMEIIRELEPDPRGIYTGCIGYIMPGRKANFNVAIRTVMIDRHNGMAEYGVGGGIVWDSTAEREYEECFVKAAVLTAGAPEFEILETILWERGEGYFLLDKHLARIARSAEYFDYAFDAVAVERRLNVEAESFLADRCKVRVKLSRGGGFTIASDEVQVSDRCWRLGTAKAPVNSGNVFLYHKTTSRAVYEDAKKACPDCDDVLLFNERGELTESTIANVVVEKDGVLVTPPVSCGLLGGIFREFLLERGEIHEGIITLDDLKTSKKIFLINSVRKWITAGY